MGVFVQEFFLQCFFLWVIGVQVDDVLVLVVFFGDQFINCMLIGGNYCFWVGICVEVVVGLLVFEVDVFGVKLILNCFGVGVVLDWCLWIGYGKKS